MRPTFSFIVLAVAACNSNPNATDSDDIPAAPCMQPGEMWGPCVLGACNDTNGPPADLMCFARQAGDICYPTANCGWHECGKEIGEAAVAALPASPCLIACVEDAGCGAGAVCSDGACVWPSV